MVVNDDEQGAWNGMNLLIHGMELVRGRAALADNPTIEKINASSSWKTKSIQSFHSWRWIREKKIDCFSLMIDWINESWLNNKDISLIRRRASLSLKEKLNEQGGEVELNEI